VPVVAVPFGRDLPEVGRRIAESGTGVLVKRADLGVERLRSAVREARGLRVAGRVSGGPAAFADAAGELVPKAGELELEAHGDRSLIR
jgi:UDP:flavonoid glycosyltransferase YjiC (YdhE family)